MEITNPTPHVVFVSYSHHDEVIAASICAALEEKDLKCWIAPRDVTPGKEWAESIVDAIDESRVLVLVLSSNSNGSPQVIREVGRAASRGIPMVAFRTEVVTLSKSMEFFISSHQWMDALTQPMEHHLQKLAKTVQLLLDSKPDMPGKTSSRFSIPETSLPEKQVQTRWRIGIIGCGQNGAQIAAAFTTRPSFQRPKDSNIESVRYAVLDFDPGIGQILAKNWGLSSEQGIYILPMMTPDEIVEAIEQETGRKIDIEKKGTLSTRSICGLSFIGRITARKYLLTDNPIKEEITKNFHTRGLDDCALVVCNSLTGGTGTDLSPVVVDFLHNMKFHSQLLFNLSVLPDITHMERLYPANILGTLYKLLNNKQMDGIILIDNEVMHAYYRCDNNKQINNLIQDMLMPIMIAPSGTHTEVSLFRPIDGADIRRCIRQRRGFAGSELCAIGFAKKKAPGMIGMKCHSPSAKVKYILRLFSQLVDEAMENTTVGPVNTSEIIGGIVILSAPPEFYALLFDPVISSLTNMLANKINKVFELSALTFPGMKEIRISILLSGVSSKKLSDICQKALTNRGGLPEGNRLGDQICNLETKIVEDLMVEEFINTIITSQK